MYTLWSDMDRLFNILNDREHIANAVGAPKFRMNLLDKGDSLLFIAELPGIADKDIELEIHNDTLNLCAKRMVQHSKDNTVFLAERSSLDIKKSISLPLPVDIDNTTASFKDGILRVTLPKSASSRPQRIAINA